MFQFPGFAPCLARCRNCLRRVAPFGNPRINGYLPLPAAYRSLSRPSSPPRAKASFMCLFLLSVFPLRKVAFLFVSLVRSLHTSLAASLLCLAAEPRGNGYFLKVCASLVRLLLYELVFYLCYKNLLVCFAYTSLLLQVCRAVSAASIMSMSSFSEWRITDSNR